MSKRPEFPKRAVVTAGMPYGDKELHFGHIGAVFIPADIFSRFLRDRIGEENVIFVSGTDCYGAGIEVKYQGALESGFNGSIQDFVSMNNKKQKETLDSYQIALNLYAGSSLGEAGEIHKAMSAQVFNRLYDQGVLKLEETLQFYDDEKKTFLNGRQVIGRCPIQGCKSETAYAEECSLGHQYSPSELIAPKSVLSGKVPSRVAVKNWFFDLPSYHDRLEELTKTWAENPVYRKSLSTVVGEFLHKPSIFVKKELIEDVKQIADIPDFTVVEEDNKASNAIVFEDLAAREKAVAVLQENSIRYRTGKTLVPFRLSGNVAWGIPIPEKEGAEGLTFWVWPESLWAPVSFTKAYLGDGESGTKWEKWWKSQDAKVYQFLGEDNIYFYAIAEPGLFMALDEGYGIPDIVPVHHLLYGKTKASSSGANKPPTADELLDYYTPEQLRLHFMNANLGERSVGFEPKAILNKEDHFDSVLYEGNLITNVVNRLVRSCFYTLQKQGLDRCPENEVSQSIKESADKTILEYERLMHSQNFVKVFELLNLYAKDANKEWAVRSKSEDPQEIKQLLADMFHVVRVCAALFHPIVPKGCEMIREYLGADEKIWSWEYIFEPLSFFVEAEKPFKFLEPRIDFFAKHPSQVKVKGGK